MPGRVVSLLLLLAPIWAVLFVEPTLAATGAPPVRTAVMPVDPARSSHYAWEPGLAVFGGSTVWAVGNHCQELDQHGPCQLATTGSLPQPDVTPVWQSSDGGRSYRFVSDALRLPGGVADRPGGLDTDIAVAPVSRPGLPALLYVASSWISSIELAISADGGRSWVVSSLTADGAVERPWLATAGPCDLFLSFHPVTGAFDVASVPVVDRINGCSTYQRAAAGQLTVVPSSSVPVEPASRDVTNTSQDFAKIVASAGVVYQPYLTCDTPLTTDQSCTAPGSAQTLAVAESRDNGASFLDVRLPASGLHANLNDGTWPLSLAANGTGGVAVAVVSGGHVWLWLSRDFGRTWRQRGASVDSGLGWSLASVPSVAFAGNQVVVAWYGSPPVPTGQAQDWSLVVARSFDAGGRFGYTVLPPVLATTPHAVSLADGLYDDFGAAITTGGAVALVYTQSCVGHPATDTRCPPLPPGTGTADVVRSAWLAGPAAASVPAPTRMAGRPTGERAPAASTASALPATGASPGVPVVGLALITLALLLGIGQRDRSRRGRAPGAG